MTEVIDKKTILSGSMPNVDSLYSFEFRVVRQEREGVPAKEMANMAQVNKTFAELAVLERVFVEQFLGTLNDIADGLTLAMEKK